MRMITAVEAWDYLFPKTSQALNEIRVPNIKVAGNIAYDHGRFLRSIVSVMPHGHGSTVKLETGESFYVGISVKELIDQIEKGATEEVYKAWLNVIGRKDRVATVRPIARKYSVSNPPVR